MTIQIIERKGQGKRRNRININNGAKETSKLEPPLRADFEHLLLQVTRSKLIEPA